MINTCHEVAKKLINLNNVFNSDKYSNDTLLFPKYQSDSIDKIRISEQESKILFANHFLINEIYFSIEVPTMSKFIFKGKTPRAARYDLATYISDRHDEIEWVIELKAHNPEETSIKKDLEKMLASNCNCVWFHTLKNEDKATIPSILNKFRNSFDVLYKKPNMESSAKMLLFIVVIGKKLLYSTEFQLDKWDSDLPIVREKLIKENLT